MYRLVRQYLLVESSKNKQKKQAPEADTAVNNTENAAAEGK
jgi:hypothetical protein